jgi:hypothetical protein
MKPVLSRCREQGSAVIVVMAILAILLIYLAANIRTLSNLKRELGVVERQQTNRLATASVRTNAVASPLAQTNSAAQVSGQMNPVAGAPSRTGK